MTSSSPARRIAIIGGGPRGLWAVEELIERARDGQPMAAILWGRDARNLAPQLAPMPCVESPHPSPLSASRGFFGSRPFTRTNALLAEQGADPVDWSLP